MTAQHTYYIIMNQKDMLENQVLEEILRERANYYFSKSKPLDFWLLANPNISKFLTNIEESQFFKQNKDLCYNALISTDYMFINWIKLRLGYFENLNDFEKKDIFYVSDGIYSKLSNSN